MASETADALEMKRQEETCQTIANLIRKKSESGQLVLQEEILTCLEKMSDQKEYQDIAQTTTSTGTVFLYSDIYLDPGYASMLAEWLDVGQFNNP
jgi:hypothetical protein